MCCCGKPTINGEPGAYSWDGKHFSTRHVNPPELAETDELIYDEPGRCGGLDCHAHHFRLVKSNAWGTPSILVRHGGGDERVALSCVGKFMLPSMVAMDSNSRYWLMHTIYSAASLAESQSQSATNAKWRQAAAEGRIKTRKNRKLGTVKVWVEDAPLVREAV